MMMMVVVMMMMIPSSIDSRFDYSALVSENLKILSGEVTTCPFEDLAVARHDLAAAAAIVLAE